MSSVNFFGLTTLFPAQPMENKSVEQAREGVTEEDPINEAEP
jgi:hypothetical protein